MLASMLVCHLLVCRQIELQQEQEDAELRELWNELRQKLVAMFHIRAPQPTVTCTASASGCANSMHSAMDDSIGRLTGYDSIGELIERLESLFCRVGKFSPVSGKTGIFRGKNRTGKNSFCRQK